MNAKFTIALVVVLLVAATATSVTAASDAKPSLTVALSEDGSATVVLTMTYDLGSDAERDAFRALENDSDTRTQVRQRFRDRMASVAASASNATDRQMSVESATIDVRTTADGETGVVELSVTWNGLAAVEGDRLVLGEPFASGFETDRTVTVLAPEGYEVASATPEPSTTTDRRVTWKPGTNLDGFEVTLRPATAEVGETTTTDGSGTDDGEAAKTGSGSDGEESGGDSPVTGVPGFGVGIAVASLLGAVLLWRRR